MKSLVQTIANEIKMTSLDVAEVTGKNHQHVMRDVRNEIEELGEEISQSIFGQSTYTNERGREYPCYTFGKKGAMQLALKYDAKTRYKVIEYIEYLENNQQQPYKLPTTYKEALLQLVEKEEENEKLQLENKELQPKATYHDLVLQSETLLSTTQIAKDLGTSARTLNKKLHELGVQYKKGKRWFLYHKYQDKGYTQSKTYPVNANETKENMYWTQKGKKFIFELMEKEFGITPPTKEVI